MVILNSTVKISGRRLRRLSVHSSLNYSLWLFFMTKARMKGDMQTNVKSPVAPFAHQWGRMWRKNCSVKVSITAVTAMHNTV